MRWLLLFKYHQNCLLKDRYFTASAGLKAVALPKADLPPQTQEPRLQFYLELNRCGSFPLLYAPHSLFSIWIDFKRSEKISGSQTWKWGEWIWLTGPSGLHQNSLQGLNISSIMVFDQIRDPEIPITLRPHCKYSLYYKAICKWNKKERPTQICCLFYSQTLYRPTV